jgi:excisionase family DNA binding protein
MIMTADTSSITTADAAEIIGCDEAYVRQLLIAGKVDGQKFGRDWMVSRESAEQYRQFRPATGRPRGVKKN